jgi:protein-tyrosine phosphatase
MKADLFWIPGPWHGALAIAARPRGGDWLDDEVSSWRQAGVNVVVSLLEEGEIAQLGLLDEGQAAEKQGVGFVSFPMPDRGVPASRAAAVSIIRSIATELEAGKNVALHCRQSIGRSGLIASALLMNSGVDAELAMQTVSTARGLSVPETAEQVAWLKQLSSGRPVLNETGLESVA